MTSPSGQAEDPPAVAPSARGLRWPTVVILILLALFALAMIERDSIRAYWWASRLAEAEDLPTRAYYIASLTAVGDSAAGAIHRLARDPRAEVRALSIPAMSRLPQESKLAELSRLLNDADAEVRDSTATALAFTGADQAARLLVEHARSEKGRAAASSVAALSRLSSDEALAALCSAVVTHPDPFVRAQAVESLAMSLAGAPPGGRSDSSPATPRDAMLSLVSALADQAVFSGDLALERQIAAVSGAVATSPIPPSAKATRMHVEAAPASAPASRRTVAEVAAHWLSLLTGRTVEPAATHTPAAQAELADQCRRWMAERPQSGRPLDSPDREAPRADSADTTPSDADDPS